MADKTSIQWCDSTVNPIMGCNGCELYPKTSEVLRAIDAAVAATTDATVNSRAMLKALVEDAFSKIEKPHAGHKRVVNNTNIWHLKEGLASQIQTQFGKAAASAVITTIKLKLSCYAARLHMNKGANILQPEKVAHIGHADIFEMVTPFPGRVIKSARLPDLLGKSRSDGAWKNTLPRMIFVSDMGDAFSAQRHFDFLKSDTVPQFQSDDGRRHIWLWLTKRPKTMAKFSDEIGGFAPNVCAMTTLTCAEPENLSRVDDLRSVNAKIRGLSIEPLRERIPPESLNLKNIDWVIVGGESGAGDDTPEFHLEWAEELMEHCRNSGVAFFLKQFGRRPMRNGQFLKLKDAHGGDWDEWDPHLRVREFPKAFHQYRAAELPSSNAINTQVKEATSPVSTPQSANGRSITRPSCTQNLNGERISMRSPSEIISMEFNPDDRYVLDGIFSKGQPMTLIGPGGVGKSRLLLQLAAAMVTGKDFIGIQMPERRLRWLFLQTENSNSRLKSDLLKIKEWIGPERWPEIEECFLIHTLENDRDIFLNLDDEGNRRRLEAVIKQTAADVVVFDPLSAFAKGSMNSDSTIRAVCKAITELSRGGNPDCSIIVVHHALTGKAGAKKATGMDRTSFGKGSKELHSWTRGQINVAPRSGDDPRKLIISCGKNSDGAEFVPFGVRLDVTTMIYELDPEFEQETETERQFGDERKPSPQSVLRLVEEKPMKRPQLIEAVMDRFGCGKSSAYTLISTALDDRLVEKARSGELVPATPPAA
jgi:protein gp37